MFSEFAYLAAARPKWRESVLEFFKKNDIAYTEEWLNEIDNTLCDFRYTKRSGVIINVATTHLWPVVGRYQENGVPLLMKVGQLYSMTRNLSLPYPQFPLPTFCHRLGFLLQIGLESPNSFKKPGTFCVHHTDIA